MGGGLLAGRIEGMEVALWESRRAATARCMEAMTGAAGFVWRVSCYIKGLWRGMWPSPLPPPSRHHCPLYHEPGTWLSALLGRMPVHSTKT